ncbi:MAG: hypothetical protein ACE5HY_00725, partial [Candidatus Hydrothermarchaeales archaeon]
NRIYAINRVVERISKPINEITQDDFNKHGLAGLLTRYYSASPILALRDAGYEISEWEMLRAPTKYWTKRENRINAIRRVVKKLRKSPIKITQKDLHDNGLGGLMSYYSGSPFLALKDAGYEIEEWMMHKAPQKYWTKKENRIEAVKRFVDGLNKPITDITKRDFSINGLEGLMDHYAGSPYLALTDAGYDVTREEMQHGIFKSGAKRYKSDHGHRFRSIEERDLDNIFWNYNLKDHKHNVKYPSSNMNCDFLFGGKYWIEYAGLLDVESKYTGGKGYKEKMEKKKKIAKENKLDLTIITRKDFISGWYLKKINHIINELGSFSQKLDDFI